MAFLGAVKRLKNYKNLFFAQTAKAYICTDSNVRISVNVLIIMVLKHYLTELYGEPNMTTAIFELSLYKCLQGLNSAL
jgi:hypothetical protein